MRICCSQLNFKEAYTQLLSMQADDDNNDDECVLKYKLQ